MFLSISTLLLFLSTGPLSIWAHAQIQLEDSNSCIVTHVVSSKQEIMLQLSKAIKSCMVPNCPSQSHLNTDSAIISLLFNFEGKHYKNGGELVPILKNYTQIYCPQWAKEYACVLDTVKKSDLTFPNGTKLTIEKIKKDFVLAMDFLPTLAFCQSDEEEKQLFYKFLNDGGHSCINKKEFLDKSFTCIKRYGVTADKFLEGIRRCTPSLVKECENGEKLEKLYSQTVVHHLVKTFNFNWFNFEEKEDTPEFKWLQEQERSRPEVYQNEQSASGDGKNSQFYEFILIFPLLIILKFN